MPVNVTGFDDGARPPASTSTCSTTSPRPARSPRRAPQQARAATLGGRGAEHVTLENLFDRLEGAGEPATLNIILRADVRGSIEAIQKELGKLEHPEVKIKLLQATVGGITEADVHAGRRFGRDHHRLQRGARRKRPLAGRAAAACRFAATRSSTR